MDHRRYPKPGRVGGTLIRRVVTLLRRSGLELPLDSHIHVAFSGGSDSTALAHLLLKYGRRVMGDRPKVSLVHINHGWRGKESDEDERFVRRFAKAWGVPCQVFRLKAGAFSKGGSWEEVARKERKDIFKKVLLGSGRNSYILTAHHADDLAETLLWRLFTGTARSHGGGIAIQHGRELRPLLQVRKAELQAYLAEERQTWREDRTNHEGQLLRSKMRLELMPAIKRLFPRAVDHLVAAALEAQLQGGNESGVPSVGGSAPLILLGASGLRARRDHFKLMERWESRPCVEGETHLPGGWKLRCEKRKGRERWLLEKD